MGLLHKGHMSSAPSIIPPTLSTQNIETYVPQKKTIASQYAS